MSKPNVVIVGAGINGLVAANYLRRAGCNVTMFERSSRAGGACVSASTTIDGADHHYALGASVLGLMQRFVYEQTGLAQRLATYVPDHAKLVFFPGDEAPTRIFRDPYELDQELRERWEESGDAVAFRDDEAKVVRFLQHGYINAEPPTLEQAKTSLGSTLTNLWITGTARNLLDHYFTGERTKLYMAMTVTESGPVSLDEPYSAFTLPLMDSGSIFGGYYGFVKGGIWQITKELQTINASLGVRLHTEQEVVAVDTYEASLTTSQNGRRAKHNFDCLVLATDPLTAARLAGTPSQQERVERQQFLGTSGKLNLMFRSPIQWKHSEPAADAAFRFVFSVDSLKEYEKATLQVVNSGDAYVPGFAQIYCEGAAMRRLKTREPYDRLAVFFKNLSLGASGEMLPEVERRVKQTILEHIRNPEYCVWSRLLTPRDLQRLFRFPEGNIDHSMLTGGQTFADRTYSTTPQDNFYRFAGLESVYICGSGTYPCGSVTGTAGYMCSQNILRNLAV